MVGQVPLARDLQFRLEAGLAGHQRLDGRIVEHRLRGERRGIADGVPTRLCSDAASTRIDRRLVQLDEARRSDRPGLRIAGVGRKGVARADEADVLGVIVELALRFLERDARLFKLLGDEIARIGRTVEAALQVRLDEFFGKGIGDLCRKAGIGAGEADRRDTRRARQVDGEIAAHERHCERPSIPLRVECGSGHFHGGEEALAAAEFEPVDHAFCKAAAGQHAQLGIEEAVDVPVARRGGIAELEIAAEDFVALVVDLHAGDRGIARRVEQGRDQRERDARPHDRHRHPEMAAHCGNRLAQERAQGIFAARNIGRLLAGSEQVHRGGLVRAVHG